MSESKQRRVLDIQVLGGVFLLLIKRTARVFRIVIDRHLSNRSWKRHRQFSTGRYLAEQYIAHCQARLCAGEPSHQHRCSQIGFFAQIQGTAIHQQQNDGFACSGQGAQQSFLIFRQLDAAAAGGFTTHTKGFTQIHHHHVFGFGQGYGFVDQRLGRFCGFFNHPAVFVQSCDQGFVFQGIASQCVVAFIVPTPVFPIIQGLPFPLFACMQRFPQTDGLFIITGTTPVSNEVAFVFDVWADPSDVGTGR